MIDFKELKHLIIKTCKSDHTEDINSRFSFSIESAKLEQSLSNTDLHVIGFTKEVVSRVPTYDDLQLIEEYIPKYKKDLLEEVYDGNSQILTLTLYCTKDGELELRDQNNNPIDKEDLFTKLNGSEDELDRNTILSIIENYPIYRTLIIRKFNNRKDRFDYSIYFRSNYNMIDYIKELKETGLFESHDDEVQG